MGGKTVVLGLSGGVDSAVAARLLQEQGYTVYGHWLDIGLGGREDAQQVAETFGIPFSAGDIRRELEASVMGPFQRDYLAGRTPLPCARCNPTVKFPALFRRAEEVGADWVATGHYARIAAGPAGEPLLCRGAHTNDQAYMLARLPQHWLSRLVFPIGGYEKTQVRQLARDFGLHSGRRLRRLAGGPRRGAAAGPFCGPDRPGAGPAPGYPSLYHRSAPGAGYPGGPPAVCLGDPPGDPGGGPLRRHGPYGGHGLGGGL